MKATNKRSSNHKPSKSLHKVKAKPRPSSTAEILAAPLAKGTNPRIPSKWATHYRHLVELRQDLLTQSGRLAKEAIEATPSYSMHMADAGTDSFDRDFALSVLSSDQDALYEIDEAIKRIQNGTYGVCEITGKPIPKARLEAIPWARFSAAAQRQLERDGAVKHRQLSALSSLPATEPVELEEGEESSESKE